jgi:Ferredoxin
VIELISENRCIQCGLCIKVCPTNVFDEDDAGMPVIARQEDCQTCFMCEAYCPVDAMYVSPQADVSVLVDEQQLIEEGLLGSWRATIGWGPNSKGSMAANDTVPLLNGIRDRRRAAQA